MRMIYTMKMTKIIIKIILFPFKIILWSLKKIADLIDPKCIKKDLLMFESELKKAMSSDVKLINLIGKYISEHSEAKVIFNGDGSDELTGGYLYFHKAPDAIDFDKECRRLLKNIHYFENISKSNFKISSPKITA